MPGNTLGTAYVQIIPSAQGISANIQKELNSGGGIEAAGVSAGGGFGKSMIKTIMGLGIGKIAVDNVRKAFSEGAALQQSTGGVETLFAKMSFDEFKNSADMAGMSIRTIREEYEKLTPASDTVIANANKAYQTAGLSANEYMETVTSFSASLLQSLGGDTEKAAAVADTAVIDMSDNANKFGTSMESIQNAYQGFAKQNYTMLDNLKLGYGGTKTEMERLLKDASALSGVEYDISSLSDVYSAIHVIQESLGVTGTTAKEAAGTFSGAAGSMSAAIKNFYAALTTGGDVSGTLTAVLSSAVTFVKGNMLPMLGNMLTSLPEALQTVLAEHGPAAGEAFMKLFDTAVARLPEVFTGIADKVVGLFDKIETSGIMGKGADLIGHLAKGLLSAIPSLVSSLARIIARAVEFLTANFPAFLKKGAELVTNIGKGIVEKLPEIGQTALNLVKSIITSITSHLPEMLEAGMALLGQIRADILNAIPQIPGVIVKVGTMISSTFSDIDWVAIGKRILDGVMNGFKSMASSVGPAVKNIVTLIDKTFNFSGTIAKVRNAFNNIKNAIKNPIETARSLVSNAVSRIRGLFPLSIGRIFSNLKLPHISVSGGMPPYGIGGLGSLPHFSVSWYKKAENNPYIFTDATLFGAGERNDEILYGRAALMKDISAAVNHGGGGTEVTNYITVNGAEDPEEWASKFARQMKIQMRMA